MAKSEKVKKALKKAKKEEKKKIVSLKELKKDNIEFKKEANILLNILKKSRKKV
jgi:hypothetical protein